MYSVGTYTLAQILEDLMFLNQARAGHTSDF